MRSCHTQMGLLRLSPTQPPQDFRQNPVMYHDCGSYQNQRCGLASSHRPSPPLTKLLQWAVYRALVRSACCSKSDIVNPEMRTNSPICGIERLIKHDAVPNPRRARSWLQQATVHHRTSTGGTVSGIEERIRPALGTSPVAVRRSLKVTSTLAVHLPIATAAETLGVTVI